MNLSRTWQVVYQHDGNQYVCITKNLHNQCVLMMFFFSTIAVASMHHEHCCFCMLSCSMHMKSLLISVFWLRLWELFCGMCLGSQLVAMLLLFLFNYLCKRLFQFYMDGKSHYVLCSILSLYRVMKHGKCFILAHGKF